MPENTESEKPSEKPKDSDSLNSDSSNKEENSPDVEALPENPESDVGVPENSESDLLESVPPSGEQGGEVLPPQKKKKSWAGKIFLFLVLVLAGSGGYLYFNNLIPAKILNLVFPKQAPPKPLASVAKISPAPLPIEKGTIEPKVAKNLIEEKAIEPEVAKDPDTGLVAEEVLEASVVVPAPSAVIPMPPAVFYPRPSTVFPPPSTVLPALPETQGTNTSGGPVESLPPTRGDNFAQDTKLAEGPEKKSPDMASVAEPVVPPIEERPELDELLVERNESVQAYLDFIESSFQKLGELVRRGFNLGWDYITEKRG